MGKAADFSGFQVKKGQKNDAGQESQDAPTSKTQVKGASALKLKGFKIVPEAAQQFEILKAELGVKGQELIAEALNLLFKKHKKPPIA